MSKLLGNVAVDDFISHRLNFSNDHHNNYETARLVEIYDTDKDLILFMKDNDNAYRANMDIEVPLHHIMKSILVNDQQQQDDDDEEENSKSIEENGAETLLKNNTSSTEPAISTTTFACGTKLRTGFPGFYRKNLLTVDDRERASNLADRRLLWTFQQGEYSSSAGLLQRSEDHGDFVARYRPMGKWVQHLQFDLNAFEDGFFEGTYQNQNYDIVPVCFGGNFVTSWGTIQNSPIRNWTAIVESLSRGDNIEEGHYMERLWAHLFSPAFTKEKRNAILQRTSRQFSDGAFAGMIVTLATD
ncbi:hypothetical protein IV203_033273 [Nitzschia inconspicua]|uniref:Uncharacterized protein n=1 Tax=Nitzschia inconspicua TaxID=303405 RepID=A0A9K3KL60_9STRA|nr:hypothetical protein IV203_033273 [Nitzschia inconspicua]